MRRMISSFFEAIYHLSLRDWLILLILAESLPAIALAVNAMKEQREVMAAAQREEMLVLSKFGAALQYDVMQDAHDFLGSLSKEPFIQESDWHGCREIVKAHLQSHAPWYLDINIALPGGEVVCGTLREEDPVSLVDSGSFQDALKTKRFVVGNYEMGHPSGQPALWFRLPVLDAAGKPKAVLSSSLNLRALNSVMGKMSLPLGAVMFVVDKNGMVLTHSNLDEEKWMDHGPSREFLVRAILEGGEGALEMPGADGVPRLWGFARAGDTSEQGIYAAVGLPMHEGYSEATRIFARQLTGLVVATLVLLMLMLLNTKYLLLNKISAILGIAERLRQGDFSARTGMEGGRHELIQVGQALDEMAAQLEERDAALHQLLEVTYMKSIRDPLTGLYNRAYLNESLKQELARVQRHPRPLAVIMLDIDHFKRVNDTYGHPAGDRVLCAVAQVISRHIREGDIGCRYGGEEFLIILLEATAESVRQKAHDLLEDVRGLMLYHDGLSLGRVTVSVGIASNLMGGESEHDCRHRMEKLIQAADSALYQAKHDGRNRVVESSQNAWEIPELELP
ncbi:MAG: GGDEF domain-containing protein [Sulfuricella sp.]|nr:GGDEF domain-containing protein [Sulfuricella sp.]